MGGSRRGRGEKRKKKRKKKLPKSSSFRSCSTCSVSGCRLRTRACCLVRQWVHEAVGRLSHIFHVKEALVSCAFFQRAPYIWQSLRRCSCVSSWRHVEEVHTISSSSFHRTRQVCLQLRASRSFTMRLPLVSALKVVLTSGRCKISWSWRVPVGFALKVVWTTGRMFISCSSS